jgi:hypothetical protein
VKATLESYVRQTAAVVLDSAVRIAPPEAREWGQAMRSELDYVEGGWATLRWSLGGARVLAKHALVSLLFRRGQGVPPGGELFAKSVSLRKVAWAAAVAFVLGSLIFFFAPPFRQGLEISLAAWGKVLDVEPWAGTSDLEALARQAEAHHDAAGLAFVAARLADPAESARLAEEAVRLDPHLHWFYAVVAVRHPELPVIHEWVPKLERWDAQNALPYLIAAETIGLDHMRKAAPGAQVSDTELQADPAWRNAMAAAFDSPTLDDYLDRLAGLDGKVVRRYRFNDPLAVFMGEERSLPSYAPWFSWQFAKSLLRAGDNLEARGDPKAAAKQYWAVARFGQLMDSRARAPSAHLVGSELQAVAYQRLQALSEKQGSYGEAALFGYLAGKLNPPGESAEASREKWVFGQETSRRNALVLQIAGLMALFFAALLLVAAASMLVGRRRGAPSTIRRSSPVGTVIGLASAVGMLLSSATVYLTYRPYSYIFQRAMFSGDHSQTRDLQDFLAATCALPLPVSWQRGMFDWYLPVYFWEGVILLGVIGVAFIFFSHFRNHAAADPLEAHPRVR